MSNFEGRGRTWNEVRARSFEESKIVKYGDHREIYHKAGTESQRRENGRFAPQNSGSQSELIPLPL